MLIKIYANKLKIYANKFKSLDETKKFLPIHKLSRYKKKKKKKIYINLHLLKKLNS